MRFARSPRRSFVASLGLIGAVTSLAVMFAAVRASAMMISWNNASGGNWGTPGNWNPAQVPGASDDAVITLAGTYTVTLDVAGTLNSLTLGGASGTQSLAITGNTLTLAAASAVNANGVINLSNGTFTGNGVLTVNGTFNWTGGTMSGSGTTEIAPTATLTISSPVRLSMPTTAERSA